MTITTTLFLPPEGGGKWSRLFSRWKACVREILPDVPVIVLSDQLNLPRLDGVNLLKLPASRLKRMTTGKGRAWDRKGDLIAKALPMLPDNLLYLDLDAFVVKDPRPILATIDRRAFGMAANNGQRIIQTDPEWRMRNAGVMWFPVARDRDLTVSEYRKAFDELTPVWTRDPMIEQMAWSMAWHRTQGEDLPQVLNWVPHKYGENPDEVIRHEHDKEKWRSR